MKENREIAMNYAGIRGTTFRGGQSSPVGAPLPHAKLGRSDVGVGKSATACGDSSHIQPKTSVKDFDLAFFPAEGARSAVRDLQQSRWAQW
jgi:hypothetical protein